MTFPEASFEAAFSATAFHWLDARVSWQKVARCLRPAGLLALLTHSTLHDERSAEDEAAFRALLRRYAPALAERPRPQPARPCRQTGAPIKPAPSEGAPRPHTAAKLARPNKAARVGDRAYAASARAARSADP